MIDAFGVDRDGISKGATSAAWRAAFKATGNKIGSMAADAGDYVSDVPGKIAEQAVKRPNAAGAALIGTEAALLGGAGYGTYKGAKALKAKKTKVKKSEDEATESKAHEMAEEKSEGKEMCDCKGCGGKHKKDCTCDKCYEAKKKG